MPNPSTSEDDTSAERQLITLLMEAEHLLAGGPVDAATAARCRSLISTALTLSRTELELPNWTPSAALTRREIDIAVAVGRGLTNRAIAHNEFVSVNTVRFHVRNIYRKLQVTNRAEAAVAISRIRTTNASGDTPILAG